MRIDLLLDRAATGVGGCRVGPVPVRGGNSSMRQPKWPVEHAMVYHVLYSCRPLCALERGEAAPRAAE